MYDFLTFGLSETCTYWQVTGKDGYNNPTYAAPVLTSCRWEERSEFVQTAPGVEERAGAAVYLSIDVSIGDYLAYGDQTAASDPKEVPTAHKILDFKKTPSLDGQAHQRLAYLRRAYF